MSVKETIMRHRLIIDKLRRNPTSWKEMSDYLNRHSEQTGYDFRISQRTFQRDLCDIDEIYYIEIKQDYSRNAYYIKSEENYQVNARMMEAFDIFNAMTQGENLISVVDLDNRRTRGTENLFGLLHAVKNNLLITFNYQKFGQESATLRYVHPYLLKEFKNRWYIVGKDLNDNRLKTFGLDRIVDLEVSSSGFPANEYPNVRNYFSDCFGITRPEKNDPKVIILSFDKETGNYIKTQPLHHSQEIINETEETIQVRLFLNFEDDFVMELMSFGDGVKVEQPKELVDYIKWQYQKALKMYQ